MQRLPQIPGFTLERELGRGGMGVVYRAHDARLDRIVALKLMLQAPDPIEAQRFATEARSAARLAHPSIVSVLSMGQVGGYPYLIQEYVEGESLEAKLKREGRLDPREAAALTAKLASALAHAHARGVIHRDVKPDNVLLDVVGQPRLTDFGLARVGARDLTQTGTIMGTPAYMAPEQAAGEAARVGSPADVYSLATLLYALLSGRPPFQANSQIGLLHKILEASPEPLTEIVPAGLWQILDAALAKVPEARPSAAEFGANLERWLQVSAEPQAPSSEPAVPARGWLGAAAGIVAVSLIAVGAWALGRSGSTQASPSATEAGTAGTEHTLALEVEADTWVRSTDAQNYGAHPTLRVGYGRVFVADVGLVEADQVTFLRLDLATLPSSCRIVEAVLELTPPPHEARPAAGDCERVEVVRVEQAWTEGTSTIGDALDGVAGKDTPGSREGIQLGSEVRARGELIGARCSVDLTDLVQEWVDGHANHGVCLRLTRGDGASQLNWSSREAPYSGTPQVRVRYVGEDPIPPVERAPAPEGASVQALNKRLRLDPHDLGSRLDRSQYHYAADNLSQAALDLEVCGFLAGPSLDARLAELALDYVTGALEEAEALERSGQPLTALRHRNPLDLLDVAWDQMSPGDLPAPRPDAKTRAFVLEVHIYCYPTRFKEAVRIWQRGEKLWPAASLRWEPAELCIKELEELAPRWSTFSSKTKTAVRRLIKDLLEHGQMSPAQRLRAVELEQTFRK